MYLNTMSCVGDTCTNFDIISFKSSSLTAMFILLQTAITSSLLTVPDLKNIFRWCVLIHWLLPTIEHKISHWSSIESKSTCELAHRSLSYSKKAFLMLTLSGSRGLMFLRKFLCCRRVCSPLAPSLPAPTPPSGKLAFQPSPELHGQESTLAIMTDLAIFYILS